MLFTLTGVNASQLDDNVTLPSQGNLSQSSSLKDLVDNAKDNDTIYLADMTYEGEDNTRISIDKSVNFIGCENTVIDGNSENFLFIISDNINVSFRNIKFINAYKVGNGEVIYGGALEIHNANVIIDGCQFISNSISYGESERIYGAAISNAGNLTISNSYFLENSLNSGYKHEGYGGAIYNNGHLYVNNASFIKSRGGESSRGSVIYNNKFALINNSIIAETYSFEESMGSAIFNTGDLTLTNSIIENNTIERYNFNYIYGNIFNSGLLVAYGNIFKNNTGYYKQPNSGYEGSPTIYNVGDLNLSYNAFIDNIGGFDKIYRDIYLSGGKNVHMDGNWWGDNADPFTNHAINLDKANSWLVLDVTPDYSTLAIGDTVNIAASWKLSDGLNPQYLIPLEIIFADGFGHTQKNSLADENSIFMFNNTLNKGMYIVEVCLYSFTKYVSVDVGKIKTNIVFNVNDNIYSDENLIVEVNLTDEDSNLINGNIDVSIAGQNEVISLAEGKGFKVFTNLIPNTYELKIEYGGDDNYFKSSAQRIVTIKKYPVNLVVEEIGEIYVDENFTVGVELGTEEVEGSANLYINGEFKNVVYLKKGGTIISFSNFDEGTYNLTIEIIGNEYYQATNASTIFKVKKYDSQLNITSNDIYIADNETLVIAASDDFEGQVILSINGVNNTLFINGSSTKIVLFNLASGIYDVDLIFKGNGKFKSQNSSTSFRVLKYPSSLMVDINDNVINVKMLPLNCSGSVSVYVNRKSYHLNLTNGEASFNVEYDKGTNYIFVVYNGDYYYNQSRFNTTIGEGEAIAIIGVNVTSFEYMNFNYTVEIFEENGFAIPNKVIAIEIDSKTYNVTTNSQGIGILPLNLKEGTYKITSTYKNLTTVNFITIKAIEFNLTSTNITYNEDVTVTAQFNKDIVGKVNFTLSNGLSEIIDISDGKAVYTIKDLSIGTWQVTAFFTNDLFNSTSKVTVFEVERFNSIILLDIREAFIGQDEIITVTSNNLTGDITFIVDGKEYKEIISNQTARLVLSNLDGGNHTLEVIYGGDAYHKNMTLKQIFSIKTQITDIILLINETTYGEYINVVANLNSNTSGFIQFKLNNLTKTSQINEGVAYATFNTLNVGSYTVYAFYLGDSQFMSTSNSASFNVLKAQSTIEVYVNEVVLDENIRIYAKLSPNATGKVSFRMLDYYSPRDKDIVNSTASWYITPLQSGNYTIVARYYGDNNYYASSTTFILNVSQMRSILTVKVNDVTDQERVVVKVTLKSINGANITGVVTVHLGSKSYNVNVHNGQGTLNVGRLPSDDYTVYVNYDGCDEFSSSKASCDFIVSDSLFESIILCENVTKYNNNMDVTFVITLKNAKNKAISFETIYVTLDEVKNSYLTDDEGKVYLTIGNFLGKKYIFVEFMQTQTYHSSNATGSVEILSTIESGDVIKMYGSDTQYCALFRDFDGKVLSNENVMFKIAGKSYNYNTLPNGIIRLNLNLNPGTYSIVAINPKTGEIRSNKLIILNKLSENKDIINYFGANSIYKVRAYGNDAKPVGAGKVVTFKVNGKTYNVKTDKNGYAVLSVKLNAKQYIITAEFNGTKISNKIIVKPVLTVKITPIKKNKKTKFAAKLVNTKGKIVKGKKIIFKIKGKKYIVKTNKKGIANLKIKLKLKKGTYKVYVIYGKSKIVKKIKIK